MIVSGSWSRVWHPRRTAHIASFIMSTCTSLLGELGHTFTEMEIEKIEERKKENKKKRRKEKE